MTCVIQKINEDKILVNFENDLNGFVKKTNLAKVKTEQNTSRFAVGEKIDAKVIKKVTKDNSYENRPEQVQGDTSPGLACYSDAHEQMTA